MEILRFALLGLATGAIYGLLSQGLVLIYRGSGLLNFAHGALALFGAYAYYQTTLLHWPRVVGAIFALILTMILGGLIQMGILRTMRNSSQLSRVIATLGILVIIQSAAFLKYGQDNRAVPSLLPNKIIHLGSNQLPIGEDRIYVFGICLVLTIGLYVLYRRSAFGRITSAVAEHELAAATLGYSPNFIATANWAIGSLLAGLSGILIAPIIFLEPTTLVLLVIPAMSAALVGEFISFPITFVAALALGVGESELDRYVNSPGWGTAAPFLVVILMLIVRGRGLPLRSFVLDRLPAVGTGRPRWLIVALLGGAMCWITLLASPDWSTAIATTASYGIICLSVVVLTGYAGQLSLAQFVIAGMGALAAAHLAPHMNFVLALIIGAFITGIIGAIVGLPALRTRGVTLAVATLGLGGAVVAVVINNTNFSGGVSGFVTPTPSVFGWSIDPIFKTNRYAFVVVVVLILLSLAVANLRRGVVGRRLLAVRSNERAAAALGVNVSLTKTYAFLVASTIAGAGGIMLAFQQPLIQLGGYDVFTCILVVAVTVTGGVGNIPGAYIGCLMISGGVASQLLNHWSTVNEYLPLAGGILLVLNLMAGPDGLFEMNRRIFAPLVAPLISRLPGAGRQRKTIEFSPRTDIMRVSQNGLDVRDVSVSFGGVHAVRDVSISVRPGEVHGLIGPNGAGKTTLIDAITGFVRAKQGTIVVGDTDLSGWAPRRRAQAGLTRSFQSLELFNDLTIGENVAVASDKSTPRRYLTDFLVPGKIHLNPAASEALRQFQLDDLVDKRPTEISFGQRKTVAIARSIASSPSVLLLDEPAAGLDDQEAAELAVLIRELANSWGIAVLLVEHKVDMIMSISDRITVMQSGGVLATGTPDEIQRNPVVLDAYLGVQDEQTVSAV